jgi:hypothetical protein
MRVVAAGDVRELEVTVDIDDGISTLAIDQSIAQSPRQRNDSLIIAAITQRCKRRTTARECDSTTPEWPVVEPIVNPVFGPLPPAHPGHGKVAVVPIRVCGERFRRTFVTADMNPEQSYPPGPTPPHTYGLPTWLFAHA